MLINGKKVGFLKTVKVNFDIKAMCPNKDTNKLPELFDPQLIDVADVYANSMKFIMALNHGYEDNLHYYIQYPINYKSEGYYVLMTFEAAKTLIEEIKRVIGITDGVIRRLITKI